MKRVLIFLFFLTIAFNSRASHLITYYVYHEVSYPQGPWTKTDLLEESGYTYLAAEKHEDMLGTTEEELVKKILSRLQDQKPETYNWSSDLNFEEDTVVISTGEPIEGFETATNEITASLIFNGFKAVKFKQAEESKTFTLEDISLPYLDLIAPPGKSETKEIEETEGTKENTDQEETVAENNDSRWNGWLIASVLVNLGLILLLVLKRRK